MPGFVEAGASADPEAVVAVLRAAGLRLAVAESCTGGALSAALTAVAGASAVFDRGFVCYSNPAKTDLLGVPQALMIAHGAVSQPCVEAMAKGALRASGADIALAVTGVAGPDGGTVQKPVGLAWMAVARGEAVTPQAHLADLNDLPREKIRDAARASFIQAGLEVLLAAARSDRMS